MKKLFLTLCILSVLPLISEGRFLVKPALKTPLKTQVAPTTTPVGKNLIINPKICSTNCAKQLGVNNMEILNRFPNLIKDNHPALNTFFRRLPYVNTSLVGAYETPRASTLKTTMLSAVLLSATKSWDSVAISNLKELIDKVANDEISDVNVRNKLDEMEKNCRI